MNAEDMKNMIVIKNLPSNILDEAIVILKPNIKLKSLDIAENKNSKNVKKSTEQNSKKFIINEAEMVIGNYISKIEKDKKKNLKINKEIETKCKRVKIISIFLSIMLLVSFIIK